MSRALVLRPPAKINLTLHVGGRRPDGFHEVRTLIQSIALTDNLSLTPRAGKFGLAVRSPGVPEGRDNLVWRAAEESGDRERCKGRNTHNGLREWKGGLRDDTKRCPVGRNSPFSVRVAPGRSSAVT